MDEDNESPGLIRSIIADFGRQIVVAVWFVCTVGAVTWATNAGLGALTYPAVIAIVLFFATLLFAPAFLRRRRGRG